MQKLLKPTCIWANIITCRMPMQRCMLHTVVWHYDSGNDGRRLSTMADVTKKTKSNKKQK